MHGVTRLDLSKLGLEALPDWFWDLNWLTSLDLARNRLTALPDRIGDLAALTSLDLSDNKLTALPDRIGDLAALTTLRLSGNGLTALPDRIGDLAALTGLELSRNRLTLLPDRIGDLTALTSLNLAGNELTALPDRIGDLAALTGLELSRNGLTLLPDRIGDLTALTSLKLAVNELTALPDRIGDLTALRGLELSRNRLTLLPDRIGDLTALTSLNLAGNELTALPDRIGDLAALTWLNLLSNELTALPDRIGDLNALTWLGITWNRLTTLPNRIGDLTALTTLHVSHNQLTTLPSVLGSMSAMTQLQVGNNPLVEPPAKIAERDLGSLRRYFALKAEGRSWVWRSTLESRALNLFSMLAIGETCFCVLALLGLVASGETRLLVSGIAVAPLLLMRTPDSMAAAIDRLVVLGHRLKIRSKDRFDKQRPRTLVTLAGSLFVLGVGSQIIKVVTAIQFARRWASVAAIPANFASLVARTDALCPPELVPGAEQAYAKHRKYLLTASDLGSDFTRRPDSIIHGFFSDGSPIGLDDLKDPPVSVVGVLSLGLFFLIAWLYRFALKSTCLIYWPFLLVHRYDDERQIVQYAIKHGEGDWWKAVTGSALMIGIGAFALLALLQIAGVAGPEGLIGEVAPKWAAKAVAAFDIAVVPKIFFTSLFAMAICYLAARLALSLMRKSHDIAGDPMRGDFRFWLSVFKAAAIGQNVSLCAATIMLLTWAWPRFLANAGELWRVFF